MGGTYFDDEQEIGPQGLALLRNVLADLFRDQSGDSNADEELKAMARSSTITISRDDRALPHANQCKDHPEPSG